MRKAKRSSGVVSATATGAKQQPVKSLGFGETPASTATRKASTPLSVSRYKRGDVGPDGRVFWGYRLGSPGWLSREKFDQAILNLKNKYVYPYPKMGSN